MKKDNIKVIIKIKDGFISVNSLYSAKVDFSRGKPHAKMYKNPKATVVERVVRDQLRAVDWSDYIDFLRTTKKFKLLIQLIVKSNVSRKDISNYIKNLEDIWTRFVREDLGISSYDDRLHVEVHAYKSTIPGIEEEIACLQVSESNFNMRFDQLEKPEQILFHFEGDSTWETKEFKKEFKALGLKYQLCNTDKKIKDHNTDVYFVSYDEETFMEKLIDLMDILYSKKDSGFCYVGILGNPKDSVVDKINSLGGSTIKAMKLEKHIDIIKLFKDDATC